MKLILWHQDSWDKHLSVLFLNRNPDWDVKAWCVGSCTKCLFMLADVPTVVWPPSWEMQVSFEIVSLCPGLSPWQLAVGGSALCVFTSSPLFLVLPAACVRSPLSLIAQKLPTASTDSNLSLRACHGPAARVVCLQSFGMHHQSSPSGHILHVTITVLSCDHLCPLRPWKIAFPSRGRSQ